MRIRHITLAPAMTLLALALLVWAAPATGQSAPGQSGQENISGLGYIDWVNQRAVASGYGVPKVTAQSAAQANISARRAAVVDARRNLLEVVKKIRIDSATRVENLMAVSDTVTTRVNGIIQYSQMVGEQRKPDGSFVVAVSVPLVGELAGELLASGAMAMATRGPSPDLTRRLEAIEQRLGALEARMAVLSAAVAQGTGDAQAREAADAALTERLTAMSRRLAELEAEAPAAPAAPPAPLDTPYTGLVVDARGTGFQPCLRPRILGEDGGDGQAIFYPGPDVDQATAVRSGYVRYYRDLAQAQQSDAAGTRRAPSRPARHPGRRHHHLGPGRRAAAPGRGRAPKLPQRLQGGGGLLSAAYARTGRDYRRTVDAASGETAFQVVVEQTDLWVVARQDKAADTAEPMAEAMGRFLRGLRGPLKAHMELHPEFAVSLTPVPVPSRATPTPALVRAMAEAARTCGVGPMAAVAGAIAQAVADAFRDRSPDILVENGGDCFMHSTRDRVAALLADPQGGASLGLALKAAEFPLALCASSATIGHSLSLGHGELVVVKADTGALADAAATALCNILQTPDDLTRVTDAAASLKRRGLRGVFAQHGGKLAAWGEMELVALD